MEELTARKQAVLDTIDEQIHMLEKKLAKAQPLFDELNTLRATRRVLLSERGTTAAGAARHQLSMESVIHFMREADGPVQAGQISEALGVPGATVRSHLNRHKNTRYQLDDDGWTLIGGDDEGDS